MSRANFPEEIAVMKKTLCVIALVIVLLALSVKFLLNFSLKAAGLMLRLLGLFI